MSLLWPGLALLLFFGVLEGYLWFGGDERPGRGYWFFTLLAASTSLRILVKNIRSHYYKKFITGLPALESATGLQVALNAAGYSLGWTENHDAAILFAIAGGAEKVRHAVVFVPADGHIWYTVHDPAGRQFAVTDRKPLQDLVRILQDYFRSGTGNVKL